MKLVSMTIIILYAIVDMLSFDEIAQWCEYSGWNSLREEENC